MKRNSLFVTVFLIFSGVINAQISFNDVNIEGYTGTGQNEAMFIVDFDSDSIGVDSSFAWIVRFDADSISGDSILSKISTDFTDFTYDYSGGFLNNVNYVKNFITYTNPNPGWFSIIESNDGVNWNWNNGISDYVENQMWLGVVVMNTSNYDAFINVPLVTNITDVNKPKVKIYPNPGSDKLYIDCENVIEIKIIDNTGKMIYKSTTSTNIIDIQSFANGMYKLIISTNNGIICESFIKQ
ncbi:MAG: hypothetical protein Kow0068_04060 [Marinilabiliales bacterium]